MAVCARLARAHTRPFSSTPAACALGPHSPSYIDVPKPAQPTFARDPAVKGHLPVPRDITKTRTHQPDVEGLLRRSTRAAQHPKTPGPFSRDADVRLHKQRLAETRKAALRDGLDQLHARKHAADAHHLARIQQSGARRTQLANAPRRPVDVLTETTVAKGVRDFLAGALPPPNKNIDARRRAYHQRQHALDAVRHQRLHDLYTNARTFIVDDAQLDRAIDDAFGDDANPVGWDMKGHQGRRLDGNHEGLSPWAGAMPEGVADKMQKLRGGEGVGLARDRVKTLAEELTGGRM